MKLTPDDPPVPCWTPVPACWSGAPRAFPFLIAVMERRGYDKQVVAILAKLHPQEAHKLVLWSRSREQEEAMATLDRYREGSDSIKP
jgi:hypothetical protein